MQNRFMWSKHGEWHSLSFNEDILVFVFDRLNVNGLWVQVNCMLLSQNLSLDKLKWSKMLNQLRTRSTKKIRKIDPSYRSIIIGWTIDWMDFKVQDQSFW